MVSGELYHHGIKGMKWGVRRYQRSDGSYTPEGIKRYSKRTMDLDKEYSKRKKASEAALDKDPYASSTTRKIDRTNNAYTARSISKDLDTIDRKGLSKSAKKYEKEYLDKGYSPQDAKVAAFNKDRTKKVLLVAGGAAVAGVAAYAGYKYWKQNADHVIKSDLYRFSPTDGKGLHDAFYATPHKRDAKKYVGLYGGGQMGAAIDKGYQKTISVGSGLKIAGDKSGRKVLSELMDDDGFRKDVKEALRTKQAMLGPIGVFTKQGQILDKAISDMNAGKIDSKNVYEAFNVALAGQSSYKDRFLGALRNAGFDGVIDVNDQRKSGYNARMPIIVANPSKVNVTKVREIGKDELGKAYQKEAMKLGVKELGKMAGLLGGSAGGVVAGARGYSDASRKKQIREYRKEHPNSKMTDLEILDSLTDDRYKRR